MTLNDKSFGLLALAGAAFFLGIAALLAYEAFALWTGQPTITYGTRCAIAHWSGPAGVVLFLVGAGLGALVYHFFQKGPANQ